MSRLHPLAPTAESWLDGTHLDALLLFRALSEEEGLVAVCALHPQEAIGGVANPRWQNFVPEHGIDHGALPIARPRRNNSEAMNNTVWAVTL